MVKSTSVYQGGLRCQIQHEPSGTVIQTDAPKDNKGKGESFSPSDLLGAALGSCILTTIAINAEPEGISLEGAKIEVTKIMVAHPRRVGELNLKIQFPKTIPVASRAKLEEIVEACPVHRSLHPDIQSHVEIVYI